MAPDHKADIKRFREDAGQALCAAAAVLEAEIVALLLAQLRAAVPAVASAWQVRPAPPRAHARSTRGACTHSAAATAFQRRAPVQDVEAVLYAFRSVAPDLSVTELPQLAELFELAGRLPPYPRLTYTTILTIGAYAEWFQAYPDRLPGALDFVLAALPHAELFPAATTALRDLAHEAGGSMIGVVPALLRAGKAAAQQDARSRTVLAEATALVLSHLPLAAAAPALDQYFQPSLDGLDALLRQAQAAPDALVRCRAPCRAKVSPGPRRLIQWPAQPFSTCAGPTTGSWRCRRCARR